MARARPDPPLRAATRGRRDPGKPPRGARGAGEGRGRRRRRVGARVAAPGAGAGDRGRLCPERVDRIREALVSERVLTMSEALNEALHEEMRRDENVLVIGEDIAGLGGLFQVTAGLLEQFGPRRVIDSPISEAGIAGAGVGAAIVGCRPVVELQISDFVTLTMDQVVNHAAKWRYMSGGRVSVPFVIRGPISNGIGMAAQHSQSLEAWFVHAPGLIVAMPSTPCDAKGLLKSAIREPNPVVFLEKRLLYSRRGPVPAEEYTVPIGVADVKRAGRDATVVGTVYSSAGTGPRRSTRCRSASQT